MINSAEEFVRLRTSDLSDDYSRTVDEEASVMVWRDVISRFPEMREWVAHNKTVPLEILEILARDQEPSVRATVADKRKLSLGLFNLLSRDQNEVVRQRVAYNKKTPLKIIELLANDPVPLVRNSALRRLGKGGA